MLVTGGAGFIGSNLCRKLLEEGNSVICLDNLSTGSIDKSKTLRLNRNLSFQQRDVQEPYYYEVEQIYNLACPASIVHYQKDRVATVKTNVYGILNALDLARERGGSVLQASTSEVYGDALVSPQSEEYWGNVNPTGPRACYDEGKRVAETLMFSYSFQYDTSIRIVRIFNAYGPGMMDGDGRVIPNFIQQALRNQDITIYGDGKQTRSFCYIDDLVKGLIAHMNNKSDFIGPVNLGNTEEISIAKLAEKIIQMTGSSSKIVYCPLPKDDPCQRKPDISLAKNRLSWEPKVSLDRGLEITIGYYRKMMRDGL